MSNLERVALLGCRSSTAFSDSGGRTSGRAAGLQSGWQDVAASLASPVSGSSAPVAEFARLLVLGELSRGELSRLTEWVGGSERQASVALLSTTASFYGDVFGERTVARLLGVTRHAFRKNRASHDERVARCMELLATAEYRLARK
mgnify:CR=1 FL=1|tara:strand:- start:807 stop:1244 length:438 start_codon:yes stop_codon:yes gene_type:complete